MKRQLLFLLLGLFFVNSVLALDCQYTGNESYDIFEEGLYNLDGDYIGAPLEFKDFSGGSMNIQGCNSPSFKIYNPTDKNLVLNISYQTSWSTAFGGRSANHYTTISINKYSSSDKLQGSCPDLGSGSISQEGIKYTIFEPEEIILKNEKVTKQKEICKLCGNKICLNDGTSCNSLYDDLKCGSEICNIAGFCGNQKVVDCPEGKINCQDKTCLEPSVKEEGESYMCSFECKSDRFENGTCLKSSLVLQQEKDKRNKNFIIFGVIILIILSAGVGYFALRPYIKNRKEEETKTKEATTQRQKEEKALDVLRVEANNLFKEIECNEKNLKELKINEEKLSEKLIREEEGNKKRIKAVREKTKKEINKLEEQKINKSIEAKKAIDKEIEKVRSVRREEIKSTEEEGRQKLNHLKKTIRQNETLRSEEKRIKSKLSKSIAKKNEDILEIESKDPERRQKKLLHRYIDKYGRGSGKVSYDEGSFIIKYPNGRKYQLHRHIYYKEIDRDIKDKQIHHIDSDPLNNEVWNLISLPEKEHDRKYQKFFHYKIKGNSDEEKWQSGIDELKEQLSYDTKEKPFPEHIQEAIKERRKEKISGRHVRTSHRRRR